MFNFIKKIFPSRSIRQERFDPDEIVEEKWDADFSKPARSRFDIRPESSYDAYIRSNSLVLGLKKEKCLAWIEDLQFRYGDQVIEARISLDAHGGYAAAGFMFRMVDDGTYYSVLISNKGYFRLDVLRNGKPLALIGWTELPVPAQAPAALPRTAVQTPNTAPLAADREAVFPVDLTIIAYGSHLVLAINGVWAAEIRDSTIPAGRICFAAASYEAAPFPEKDSGINQEFPRYTAEAILEAFSVESRLSETAARYEAWAENPAIPPLSRFRLAETFAAMDQPAPALVQLKKAWEGREKNQQELLLAGKLALTLELLNEAEEYIDACLALDPDTPEGKEAARERAKFLYAAKRYEELKTYGETILPLSGDPVPGTLLGHAYWHLHDYAAAAAAYDRVFEMDPQNGLAARNAANGYELLDRKEEALERYLKAGRAFLAADNYEDLGSLISKLLGLGAESWESHALAGKWAFGIENWAMAEDEFSRAETLRRAMTPEPEPDPALVFLRGLLLIRRGDRAGALALLEEAARLAPDYPLFRFRLAENRFLLKNDPEDPKLAADMEAALTLAPEDGWVHNLAAQIALTRGDTDGAAGHLEKAARFLGEAPAIRVNRAVLYYLQGSLDKALAVLDSQKHEDPEGLMANCGGNLLVRAGRYEEADEYYRKALSIAPDNTEYLCNRASCLIEEGLYGEADELLSQAHGIAPSPGILELIAYVATKKGEYQRAETACMAALEMDPHHLASLLSLGWIYASSGRWEETEGIVRRLDELDLSGDAAVRRDELRARYEDALTRLISCASCKRRWRVPRDPAPAPPIRLFAIPPDDFPAGTCPECGKTYCIGCAKQNLGADGRFLCPGCGKPLKLMNEGLKKIIYDWASEAIPPAAPKG
ncbi:MAG: tetratricopeptide repeat protein [Treponema sp.]|jgi:tetratricopeptide (TPR) repeat protein|nr:tetratricopeptide repeat protein [Treponema sp.]